ncbi:MAG TPA: IPT/TIG domain-containing protein, partial [Gemmataceae bacterium]|nr:IPT/TIG domain-containing protein [Gemmataceae bacterium]
MSLPSQRRKSSPIREGGLRSWRSGPRCFVRPQLEQLEDRVLLNYDFGSTPFQWVELNGDPTATNLIGFVNQGNYANPIDLGSNTINFYGNIFGGATGIWASSNGLITFGNGNSDFRNGDLMTDPGQAAMAPLWSSYFKYDEPTGPMVLSKIDTLNNRLIIEWNQVHDYVTYNNGSLTFEAIIQLNTGATPGNIVFNYLQLDYFLGSGASVGIKDGGTQGPNAVVISVNALNPLVDNNHAILFAWPSAPKIPVISDLSTNTASEGSPDINVTVNGANFNNTSLVKVNDTELATSFINDTQLQATIPASLLAEEGNLTVTVSTPGPSGGTSNAVSFIVMDAPLTAAGAGITATEGASFSGPIANFSDSNPGGTLSDYAATISWGDGQTSTGTIIVGPNGTFVVSGDHTYADEGNFSFSVQIADVGGAAITTIGSAAVGDAALDAHGTTINATEAAAFSGVVATFTDANPYGTAGDFSAMIAWGDGLSTPGTVSANGG